MSETPESPGDDGNEKNQESSEIQGQAEGALERQEGLTHYVSAIKSIEQQVGEHITGALQHEGTVAVLTAVLPGAGGGGERIASVPLDQELWQQVQELLLNAGEEKAQDVPCIGFQCVLKDRQEEADRKKQKESPPDNF